jgi:hypothetical protein
MYLRKSTLLPPSTRHKEPRAESSSTQGSYYIFSHIHVVVYFLKARTVEPEKEPLLGKGCVTCNSGVTVESDVFCAIRAEDQLPLQQSLETAVRRVGSWCEMAAILLGRELGSRETLTCEDKQTHIVVNCRACELT